MVNQAPPEVPLSPFRPINPAIRRSDTEFRHLLEKLPAGAYTCDPEGLITYFNQHAERLWGRAPKLNDPIDRFCGSFRLYSGDGTSISHDQCWMAQALRTNREFNGHEIVIERPDEARVTVLAHANPIHDETGKLVGAVNVLVDISDRKKFEDALMQADRSKNEFLATLAHELRNPLAPIRNAIELLQMQDSLTSESHSALDVIDRQMKHMTRLVDDLLDLSRITENKLKLCLSQIELGKVLQAAEETSRPLTQAARHEFTMTYSPEPIHVEGDVVRLAQVISNIVNNAAKYTPPGGRIHLEARRERNEAVITVKDTGVGIPREMLTRIFEMFTQVDRSLDRSQGGLGIGLTVAKRLISMHHGSISAHSDGPGSGSTFIVRLPAIPIPESETDGVPIADPAKSSTSTLNILVVDDHPDAAATLAKLLRLKGHSVTTAKDGVQALQLAAQNQPDVILLDIGLPKMDGHDVARTIREEPWGKEIHLFALTGWGQEEDRHLSREAGFNHHLVKPVDPAILFTLLSQVPSKTRS